MKLEDLRRQMLIEDAALTATLLEVEKKIAEVEKHQLEMTVEKFGADATRPLFHNEEDNRLFEEICDFWDNDPKYLLQERERQEVNEMKNILEEKKTSAILKFFDFETDLIEKHLASRKQKSA